MTLQLWISIIIAALGSVLIKDTIQGVVRWVKGRPVSAKKNDRAQIRDVDSVFNAYLLWKNYAFTLVGMLTSRGVSREDIPPAPDVDPLQDEK
ncbi:hypothetical protein HDC34_001922 [Pseudoclavibacter sp. JAI123]|uniref:hypothetical protein n=1 Tax=Pseudoclavibacter sp. JAI123 TaxID=2723065 RepID=UPI0015C853BB|nr:hypothetical protein [Pseudoclavibacter sp. JAI123]NYF13628.1 hypothetical protein [Pseudoclavibacter sp. JAI123]